MKPGHVNFFDGMRVSAEHMDHLQGSLHSAIADLRGVAGAGRVQEGFEVVSNDDGSVTVQPGLAFDFERNRVVSEEPRVVTPSFEPGQAAAYVCVEYASTSSGLVEDVPTLIWDGCRVVVRPELPSPEENQIGLARVRPLGDEGSLEVETLVPPAADGRPPGPDAPLAPDAAPAPDAGPAAVGPSPREGGSAALALKQGVATSRAPNGGLALGELASRIGEALAAPPTTDEVATTPAPGDRATAPADGEGATATVPIGTLAGPLDFLWESLSCRGALRTWWTAPPDGAPGPESVAVLHGEATYGVDGLAQHSLQTVTRPPPGSAAESPPVARPTTTVVAGSLGRVPLSATLLPAGPDSGALGALLDRLELRLWVTPNTASGFEIRAGIDWKGGTDEQALRTLADSPRALAWDATIAWKALGRR